MVCEMYVEGMWHCCMLSLCVWSYGEKVYVTERYVKLLYVKFVCVKLWYVREVCDIFYVKLLYVKFVCVREGMWHIVC